MKTRHQPIENWNVRDKINELIDEKVEDMAQAVIADDVDYENLDELVNVIDKFCDLEGTGFTEDETIHAISMIQTLVMLLDLETKGEIVRRPDGTWIAAEFAK